MMTNMAILQQEINRYTRTVIAVALFIFTLFTLASNFAIPLISLLTMLGLAFIVAQFDLSVVFMFMVFLIPLSTNQKIFDSEITILMPSEPIEAIIMLAFIIKILFGYKISKVLLLHPVFWIVILGILIQFISTLNSAIPLVSIKTLFLKSCYITVFFVLSADLYLKQNLNHIKVLKAYTFSILMVGMIIFLKHLDYGLSKDISGSVTEPFYADHTIYSACLALIIPFPLLALFNAHSLRINFYQKFWLALLSIVLITFFFYTYCRAGWISFVISSLVVLAIHFGLRFRGILFTIMAVFVLMFMFQIEIAEGLKQNKADSNAKDANIEQQTKSVTNITSDQSNAERLNRWSCSWRMFLDKPFLGHGPGTYQFEYLSYQKKSEMTRISVTSAYNIKKGKGGTAHSEYLLLLAESGLLSVLLYMTSIFMVIYYALKVFTNTQDAKNKIKIMIVFFGFCTYILHAFFNNFLDTDKAALLYYTSIAAIMVEAIKLKQVTTKKTT
jgi:putative inorganic carbon (hco3(-)) transporter